MKSMPCRIFCSFVIALGTGLAPGLMAQDQVPVKPSDPAAVPTGNVLRFEPRPADELSETEGLDDESQEVSIPIPEKTEILNEAAAKRLTGKRYLSLQWVSDEDFGTVEITETKGVRAIKGEQRSQETGNTDYVTLEGYIAKIEENQFTFWGRIETKVSYLNEGKPCSRQGEFHFKATGKRKYFRLQEMENPCEGNNTVDYVDIYFNGPAK